MKTTIDMARVVYGAHTEWTGAPLDRLEQLVALVRADERAAPVQEESAHNPLWLATHPDMLTTPPVAKRQWVGLTNKGRKAIYDECQGLDVMKAIIQTEAKLKEKNT